MAPLPYDLPAGPANDRHRRDAAAYQRYEGVAPLRTSERRIVPRRQRTSRLARLATLVRAAATAVAELRTNPLHEADRRIREMSDAQAEGATLGDAHESPARNE